MTKLPRLHLHREGDRVQDILPLDYLYTHDLSRFVVAYMQEAKPGEGLNYYMKEVEEDTYYIQIVKDSGEAICRCEMSFLPRPEVEED